MEPSTAARISGHDLTKGDVIGVARIAAIQAAKRVPELVTSAFMAPIGAVDIDFHLGDSRVAIEARVVSRDGISLEMEALVACSIAALTIYDMCKAVDRWMTIDGLALVPDAGP